jgi:hypothetical protein
LEQPRVGQSFLQGNLPHRLHRSCARERLAIFKGERALHWIIRSRAMGGDEADALVWGILRVWPRRRAGCGGRAGVRSGAGCARDQRREYGRVGRRRVESSRGLAAELHLVGREDKEHGGDDGNGCAEQRPGCGIEVQRLQQLVEQAGAGGRASAAMRCSRRGAG